MALALYHNDMSLCAQKVRICLAEKRLTWESRHLVLRAAEHQQPWYRKLNSRAVVPTLVDGDKVVPESNVILEYLEEARPQPPLWPEDPYQRARARQFALISIADSHPLIVPRVRHHLAELRQEPASFEALKQVIRQKQCSDETARFRLMRAGLIRASGSNYLPRCDLYRIYFEDK